MRYKKFQIQGAVDLDEVETLHIADVKIVDGSILKYDRVPENALNSHWSPAGTDEDDDVSRYEFIKVAQYLYRMVDGGSNTDAQYGNATRYYYILPESHPSFNFDVLNTARRKDVELYYFIAGDKEAARDMTRTILHKCLPDFVNLNIYDEYYDEI